MNYTILMGSARKNGNTAALLKPFMEENRDLGVEQQVIWLYDRTIKPCIGCKICQDAPLGEFGCPIDDDGCQIFDAIQNCDVLILASPIYSWYCTPPMKAVMDRMIYAPNKYYGAQGKQPALWKMKQVAAIATCGYHPDRGADLWDEGLKRWCKHGEMDYLGMHSRRDFGSGEPFMNRERELDIRDFAHALYITISTSL